MDNTDRALRYADYLRKNSTKLAATIEAMESGLTPDTWGTLPTLKKSFDDQLSQIKKIEADPANFTDFPKITRRNAGW